MKKPIHTQSSLRPLRCFVASLGLAATLSASLNAQSPVVVDFGDFVPEKLHTFTSSSGSECIVLAGDPIDTGRPEVYVIDAVNGDIISRGELVLPISNEELVLPVEFTRGGVAHLNLTPGGLSRIDASRFVLSGRLWTESNASVPCVWHVSEDLGSQTVEILPQTDPDLVAHANTLANGDLLFGSELRQMKFPKPKGRGFTIRSEYAATYWEWDGEAHVPNELDLPELSGLVTSVANAVSVDGSVVAGRAGSDSVQTDWSGGDNSITSVIWTRSEEYYTAQALPGLYGEFMNRAAAVSADGSVVVGISRFHNGPEIQPYRWTLATGQVLLEGWDPNAEGFVGDLSPNGRAAVGSIWTSPTVRDVSIWKDDGSGAMAVKAELLEDYYGGGSNSALSTVEWTDEWLGDSISNDGRAIAFHTQNSNGLSGGYLLLLPPRLPHITSLEADATVAVGGTVTLAPAGAIAPAGFLAAVCFYGDFDGDGVADEPIRQLADPNGYGIEFSLDGAAAGDTFTYSAIAEDTDGEFSAPVSATVEVVDGPVDPLIKVRPNSLDIIAKTKGRKTDLHVELDIIDEAGEPVVGAEVTVSLTDPSGSDLLDGIGTGVTDANGRFVSTKVRKTTSGDYTAAVDAVILEGSQWGEGPGDVTTKSH